MATFNCPVFQESLYYYVTSQYGPRMHPITNKYQEHSGVDIVALNTKTLEHTTATIVAIEAGTVRDIGFTEARGYYVDLIHTSGRRSLYLHLAEGSIPSAVKIGSIVNKGIKIGYMGNTGNSSGAHLHFQVYDTDGTTIIDPMPFLAGININYEKATTLCPTVEPCKIGDRGTTVVALQKKLSQLSPDYEKDIKSHSILKNPVTFDGIYGEKLKKLVVAFQNTIGIESTGDCDEDTAKYLNLTIFELLEKLYKVNIDSQI